MMRNPVFIRTCHIFSLCSFAFAQPLFDLLAREPAFLVVYGTGLIDVLALIGILCVVIPAGFVSLELAIRAISANGAKWTHYAIVAFLVAVMALPAVKTAESWPGILLLGLSAGIGIGVAVCYASFSAVRLLFTFLSPAILLFPLIFVFRPATAPVLFPRNVSPSAAQPVSPSGHAHVQPVVLVVFDELPLTSLLDEHYRIDATRYPHFADLAQNATWFRRTVTVDEHTIVAVPAILSGTRPRPGALPTYEHYPHNIFTLLQNTHDLHVFESHTRLCPETLCTEALRLTRRQRLRAMMSDLRYVYLHLALPQEYAALLPPVTQTWKDFGTSMDVVLHKARQSYRDRAAVFSSFVASIGTTSTPGLHVIHTPLPHVPWEYFPSGVVYTRDGMNVPGLSFDAETWSSNAALVTQGYRRHLWQVQLVDNLLGQLLSRLRAVKLYDQSLIVVTADHGASFWPSASRRSGSVEPTASDVRRVPLFIKAPFQDAGAVSDRQASPIDIVPTIADILGVVPPEPLDGHSLWSPDLNAPAAASSVLPKLRASLERKLTLFGSPSDTRTKVGVTPAPYQWLRGTSIAHLPIAESRSRHAALNLSQQSLVVQQGARFLPGHITGRLTDGSSHTAGHDALAVAINGTVQNVMPFYAGPRGEGEFSILVPERAFQIGPNQLALFIVSGRDTTLQLEPVTFSWRPE